MRKLIVLEWISLDGVYDASSMGEWFLPYHTDERSDFISKDIHDSDIYLLGRKTYEMLAPHWSQLKNNEMGIAAKLNSMRKVVVSHMLKKADWNNTTIINTNVVVEIKKLKKESGGNILVAGSGNLMETLMKANLVDEYHILQHPVIMGNGLRFFRESMPVSKLNLAETKALGKGVNALIYQPAG
jgi:dihydrofolate reductase